jgi:hypothetical protein
MRSSSRRQTVAEVNKIPFRIMGSIDVQKVRREAGRAQSSGSGFLRPPMMN